MCNRNVKETRKIFDFEERVSLICDIWEIHEGLGNFARYNEEKNDNIMCLALDRGSGLDQDSRNVVQRVVWAATNTNFISHVTFDLDNQNIHGLYSGHRQILW